MCGKFTQQANEADAIEIVDVASNGPQDTVTPMRFAGVVCRSAAGGREVRRMRWGFVPADAPDQAATGAGLVVLSLAAR